MDHILNFVYNYVYYIVKSQLMSDLTNEFVQESYVFKTIGNIENNLRLRTWQIFRLCPLEGASSGTPLMILLKISQHLRLSKRGSKTGLVINAPAKYAANYSFLLYKVYFSL